MIFLSWVSIFIPDINIHMFVSQLLDFLDDANLAIELFKGHIAFAPAYQPSIQYFFLNQFKMLLLNHVKMNDIR